MQPRIKNKSERPPASVINIVYHLLVKNNKEEGRGSWGSLPFFPFILGLIREGEGRGGLIYGMCGPRNMDSFDLKLGIDFGSEIR